MTERQRLPVSIQVFMRRRSGWLTVAGAVLAYVAFVPPLLVVIPVMTHEFCTEWRDGKISMLPNDPSPDCSGLAQLVDLIPTDFYDKATVSNLSSDFNTPTGRVFLACILLSSLALLISEFPFWLPRKWNVCVVGSQDLYEHPHINDVWLFTRCDLHAHITPGTAQRN